MSGYGRLVIGIGVADKACLMAFTLKCDFFAEFT